MIRKFIRAMVLMAIPSIALLAANSVAMADEADDALGTHGFAQSGTVRIHYDTKGEGPLVVMIHGFPDFWYTWRKIHGLKDKALLSGGLNDTWKWLENDLTLVTIPEADHFVQQDAPDKVTRAIVNWLDH